MFFFFHYFSQKICFEISSESSAWQTIHMKCQEIFSLKNKKKKECHLLQILLGGLKANGRDMWEINKFNSDDL